MARTHGRRGGAIPLRRGLDLQCCRVGRDVLFPVQHVPVGLAAPVQPIVDARLSAICGRSCATALSAALAGVGLVDCHCIVVRRGHNRLGGDGLERPAAPFMVTGA